jgi:ABC-type dipeptide/oligopeptide/nickel transport system permease component
MLRFLLSRVVKGVIVLLAIAVLNFALIRAAPGDPATVMAGEAGAADAIFVQQLRERFGLDRPILEQLGIYIKGIVTFDLGFSYRQGRSVASLIGERLPATLLLTGRLSCSRSRSASHSGRSPPAGRAPGQTAPSRRSRSSSTRHRSSGSP